MENTKIAHWKENKHVWRKRKTVKENVSIKARFMQAMTRLKESVRFDFEDEEYEDVD